MYWIAVVALTVAAGFDLRKREIPDTVSAILLATALTAKLAGFHPASWAEIGLGAGAAFALTATLFSLGGLGGGDVKLLTALGATLGAPAFLPFAILTCLFGGLTGLFLRRRGVAEIAYAPVMLVGLLAMLPVVWVAA